MGRTLGLALSSLVAVGAGATGFAAGTQFWRDEPPTRIELVACGLAPGPAPMDLPLGRVLRAAPGGVSLGPFALGGVAEPITLRFEPLPDGEEKAVHRMGGVVTLPVDLHRPQHPEKVIVRCRYGAPAKAAFHIGPERLELPVLANRTPPGAPAS